MLVCCKIPGQRHSSLPMTNHPNPIPLPPRPLLVIFCLPSPHHHHHSPPSVWCAQQSTKTSCHYLHTALMLPIHHSYFVLLNLSISLFASSLPGAHASTSSFLPPFSSPCLPESGPVFQEGTVQSRLSFWRSCPFTSLCFEKAC